MRKKEAKSHVEQIKEESRALRGSIASELVSPGPSFSSESTPLLKFHGIYQYDDRDLRRALRKEGQDKAYRFMVRTKIPGGGRLSAEQWLALDRASDLYGDGTLRLTTRQDIQFHGVGKRQLLSLIRLLNDQLLTTFGACGDGVRNVLACPVAGLEPDPVFDGLYWADLVSRSLAFCSTAYVEIWLDGQNITPVTEEPVYGQGYLPRKFKIAFSGVNDNCTDILTNDIGIVPLVSEGHLAGFQIYVGGGLGSSHGLRETFPRLATPLARVSPEQLLPVLEAIVVFFRDYGDRSNRKHARLKYLVEERGIVAFKAEVERRLGSSLASPQESGIGPCNSHLGWNAQKQRDLYYLGLFVENGRIHNRGPYLKTAIREVVTTFHPEITLTAEQNLIFAGIPASERQNVARLLGHHGVLLPEEFSALRLKSMACPALPTCALALTEAERRLPGLLDELEALGCADEPVSIRMSGCPNSCSRPPVAEIGLVGRSANGYHLYVGGSPKGDRLAVLFRENVPSEELAGVISALIESWKASRYDHESFGDWSQRMGLSELPQLEPASAQPISVSRRAL
jgi:sulfite reductase (ferredoxin)